MLFTLLLSNFTNIHKNNKYLIMAYTQKNTKIVFQKIYLVKSVNFFCENKSNLKID